MDITYTGTYTNGIVLSNPTTQNPATVASTGYVTNVSTNTYHVAIYGSGYAWTVANFGRIAGLFGGGKNGIFRPPGGIQLESGGLVVNEPSGTIAATYLYQGVGIGTAVDFTAAGMVTNLGRITGGFAGISAAAAGITNGQSGSSEGSVSSDGYGIVIAGGGVVTNYGTIAAQQGMRRVRSSVGILLSNGTVANYGTISAEDGIIFRSYAALSSNTVINAGTIAGIVSPSAAQTGTAVAFGRGSNLLLVEPGAAFVGAAVGNGDYGSSNRAEFPAPGGTMTGSGLDFVDFTADIDGGASWVWAGDETIAASSALVAAGSLTETGTLTNGGTVAVMPGTALRLSGASARLVADPGAVFSGTIDGGGAALELAAGTSTGTLSGLGAGLVDFGSLAVDPAGAWVFAGDDSFGSGPVNVGGGADVAITAGASISGLGGGIVIGGAAGHVDSAGVVAGTGVDSVGVDVAAGGSILVNEAGGLITGQATGVTLAAGDTLVNAGTVAGGGGTAVAFSGNGLLTIDPGAVFAGSVAGGGGSWIELAAGGAGTLKGLGKSVAGFGHLVVDAAADWQVSGNRRGALPVTNDGTIAVARRLVLGKLGEASGAHGTIRLGADAVAEFTHAVNKGQRFLFTADSGTLKLDRPALFRAQIRGLRGNDTIDLVDTAADNVVYSPGRLAISEGGTTFATLRLFGHFTTGDFALSPDGRGGTDITLAAGDPRPPPPMPAAPDLWTMRG